MKTSKTEKILLKELNRINLKPKIQFKISKMTVDFAFPKNKIVIEIDGLYHRTRKQTESDHNRDDCLQSKGWKVRRFTAEETYKNPIKIAYKVKYFLRK